MVKVTQILFSQGFGTRRLCAGLVHAGLVSHAGRVLEDPDEDLPTEGLVLNVEGRDWPNRTASRFIDAGGLRWHVQIAGTGPAIVLLHGTGAASHSWRDILPDLASGATVIAPDLPGHGVTRGRPRGGLTLPGMAQVLGELLGTLGVAGPVLLVGHSAGAAIALQLAHDRDRGDRVLGFNPALMPFPGLAARLFPSLAKLLFLNPLVPRMMAGMAGWPGETERFLKRATGSTIGPEGLAAYRKLFTNPDHCAGAMGMMANWDLEAFGRILPGIAAPVRLIHSDRDSAVPLDSVERAAALLPHARLDVWPGLGHLAHEERPDLAVAAIREHVDTTGRQSA